MDVETYLASFTSEELAKFLSKYPDDSYEDALAKFHQSIVDSWYPCVHGIYTEEEIAAYKKDSRDRCGYYLNKHSAYADACLNRQKYKEEELVTLNKLAETEIQARNWQDKSTLNAVDNYSVSEEEYDGKKESQLNYYRHEFKARHEPCPDGFDFLNKYEETDRQLTLDSPTYAVFADCMQIKMPQETSASSGNHTCGKRGKITGFSNASRRRLMKCLAKQRLLGKFCFFLTLTYPGLYALETKYTKRDLDVMHKSLRRHFPELDYTIYRLEMQKRFAPHYHLLLVMSLPTKGVSGKKIERMCKEQQKKIIAFCRTRWPKIARDSWIKSGGDAAAYAVHFDRHVQSGHNCQYMQTRRMVQNYISKYTAKVSDGNHAYPENCGRIWGTRKMNGKPDFEAYESGYIDSGEAVELKRLVRKHKAAKSRLTPTEEQQLQTGEMTGSEQQQALKRKSRQHKRDKKYAKRIARQNCSITLFGYGVESEDNSGIITRMVQYAKETHSLKVAEKLMSDSELAGRRSEAKLDLINIHISPLVSSENCTESGKSLHLLAIGQKVWTPDGLGTVIGVVASVNRADVRLDRLLWGPGRLYREIKMYDIQDILDAKECEHVFNM